MLYFLQLLVTIFAGGFVGYVLQMAPGKWRWIGLIAYIVVVVNAAFPVTL